MNIYAILLAAAVAVGATWQVQEWRYEGIIHGKNFEQSEAARKIFESAQRQHELDIAQKDKAINDANLRAQKNQALARVLDSDVLRMREQLASASTNLPTASCETSRNYATACNAILGTMAETGAGIAGKADGHYSDTMTLEQAWSTR